MVSHINKLKNKLVAAIRDLIKEEDIKVCKRRVKREEERKRRERGGGRNGERREEGREEAKRSR